MKEATPVLVRNAQRKVRVDRGALQKFAVRAWEICRALPACAGSAGIKLEEISVVLVSDQRMAALHLQFMNIAGPTDVLTFQHGEIVISVETAQENAVRFGHEVEAEIRLYLVHGFLHLLGFDDQTPAEKRIMEREQWEVLRQLSAAAPA